MAWRAGIGQASPTRCGCASAASRVRLREAHRRRTPIARAPLRNLQRIGSLNPALEDLSHCPRCGHEPRVDFPRSISCPQCGYAAFYNPKPVAACIPRTPSNQLILLKRATEPGKGLWTFPGGFVDLGESVQEAAQREAKEEIGVEVELQDLVGVYSRPSEHVVLIVYAATTAQQPQALDEADEVATLAPDAIPWDELAFWSTEQALRDLLR